MSDTANDQQTVDTEEQSTTDQAGVEGSGVEEQDEAATGDQDESDAEDILDADTYEKVKDDPKALRKALNKAWTEKTQRLSTERKALEPYRVLIDALESDPRDAVTRLAEQFGLKVEGRTERQVEQQVDNLADQITAAVKAQLGDEYGELADRIGAGIHDALKLAVPELTKGIGAEVEEVRTSAAQREADRELEVFAGKHPEWKKHEEQMMKVMARMPPSQGVDPQEYLEDIWLIATKKVAVGTEVKKVVEKMTKSASKPKPVDSTSDRNVARGPIRPPTFREAAAAALRGERLE